MNRHYWNVYKKIGASFVADGTIPIPNEDMSDELESTTQFHDLVDGSEGSMTPEETIRPTAFTLSWKGLTESEMSSLYAKLKSYKQGNDTIKIETHISGEEFIGKLLGIQRTWKAGYDNIFDIETTFKPTEV